MKWVQKHTHTHTYTQENKTKKNNQNLFSRDGNAVNEWIKN